MVLSFRVLWDVVDALLDKAPGDLDRLSCKRLGDVDRSLRLRVDSSSAPPLLLIDVLVFRRSTPGDVPLRNGFVSSLPEAVAGSLDRARDRR